MFSTHFECAEIKLELVFFWSLFVEIKEFLKQVVEKASEGGFDKVISNLYEYDNCYTVEAVFDDKEVVARDNLAVVCGAKEFGYKDMLKKVKELLSEFYKSNKKDFLDNDGVIHFSKNNSWFCKKILNDKGRVSIAVKDIPLKMLRLVTNEEACKIEKILSADGDYECFDLKIESK